MAILLNQDSKVLVQGITGNAGQFHTKLCLDYGTQIVGGVTPGKGGQIVLGLPVFDTVQEAKHQLKCNATIIFVPPQRAAEAILEAEDAGIELIVCVTDGVPIKDMIEVAHTMRDSKTSLLLGPHSPGIISPGKSKLGIMPGHIHKPGKVGIVSRSGTLAYEAVWQTTQLGLGQSSCVGIGGDPLQGMSFTDVLKRFEEDPETEAILMIGEIGGSAEEEAAEWIKEHCSKPIAAFIAGISAPIGRRMGHAGAIISKGQGSAEEKIKYLEKSRVFIANSPAEMGNAVVQAMRNHTVFHRYPIIKCPCCKKFPEYCRCTCDRAASHCKAAC
ncbi:MAG: sucD [Chlamydiales bacterium]|jgi:succinyl-CoA synthetase alpha subunit|nr:sucD [Chlamydiales bacterium]